MECEAVSEWTFEGNPECEAVGVDGFPPVIHRDAYDGMRKRVDFPQCEEVNLGGIAEVSTLLSHEWDESVFFILLYRKVPLPM